MSDPVIRVPVPCQNEPFHVVIFDKSQHEYYAKLSDFHAQFRMVGNRSAIGHFACKEL